jgi:hypothetical protein
MSEAGEENAEPGTEYEECSLAVPYGRNLLDLSVAEIGRLALAVVEAEGPVHTEEIARRIREAFGLQKTGNRILKHIRDALIAQARSGMIKRDQEFWSIPGRAIQEIRTRRTTALPLRRASIIAPAEYHLAMLSIIEEAVAISPDDLGVETARRFGFDRTGPDLKQEINLQMSVLIKLGKLVKDDSKVRIPAIADSDSDRSRTAIPIDRGQRSGDRGQRVPSTASRAHLAVSVSSSSR